MLIHRLGRDVTVLNDQTDVPGIGYLAVNGFVLHAAEPVVVDTGLSLPERGFMEALSQVIDPPDVRWIYLTHPDRDHTGALFDLLEAAPQARVITTYLGAGIMSCERPLPINRVYLLNPGDSLDLGDRRIHAFRPPVFDSPATTGFYDERSRTAFTSDCFGAPLSTEDLASRPDLGDVPSEELRAAQLLWASVDSPWVHEVDEAKYLQTFEPLRSAEPEFILSTHLPPAVGQTAKFLDTLAQAPRSDPFVGPDQRALEDLLATFEPVAG